VALITLAYGNELMKETDGFKLLKKPQTPIQPVLPSHDNMSDKLPKTINFDGGPLK
jgi:hypothetical protein